MVKNLGFLGRQVSVDKAWGSLFLNLILEYRCTTRFGWFSHVWLVFVFHQAIRDEWETTVRPPRLGGNDKVGVFASRSPFRPNPIGLSCVKLEQIDYSCEENPTLKLSGVDLVDDTPVLDIKPYIPYADCLPDAEHGFAQGAPRLSKNYLGRRCQRRATRLHQTINRRHTGM